MTKVKVTILKGGMTAREVNPIELQEYCEHCDCGFKDVDPYIEPCNHYKYWKQAEDKCRVFTIDFMYSNKIETVTTVRVTKDKKPFIIDKESFIEGSTHEAEIIDDEKGLIRIN